MNRKYILGFDFLKALAIISIILYHINSKFLPGGFIGVDLFFVISGYLLGNSLYKEISNNKKFNIFSFINKRLRNLWPLIFVVIFISVNFITLFNKTVLEVSYKDIIPGLTFTSNWWLIFSNVGYFDSFVANPFKHLWYISVIMQAYILISLIFKLTYKIDRNRNYIVFKTILIIFAILSFTLSQILYNPQNASRVYYGTDTRIFEIILGTLTYLFYPIDKLKKIEKNNRKRTNIREYLTLISVVFSFAFIYLLISTYDFYNWVYRVGFLFFAITSIMMLISIGSENNYLSSLIRFSPINWIGKISYSLYLWHYPIIILSLTRGEKGNPNIIYTLIRLIGIILISFITYTFIEKKGRRSSTRKTFNTRERNLRSILYKYKIFIPFLLVFSLGVFGIAMPYISTAFLEKNEDKIINSKKTQNIDFNNLEKNENEKEINNNNGLEVLNSDIKKEPKKNNLKDKYKIKYKKLVLVGDSIGVNLGKRLKEIYPNSSIDAKISRQLIDSSEVVEQYREFDSPDTALIIMLGTNGNFEEEDLDNLIATFPKSKKVFVNVKVDDAWEKIVNNALESYTQKHPEISLVDWYSVAINNVEYLEPDETHPNYEGVEVLIDLILEKLR